jgi:hypothetical protein
LSDAETLRTDLTVTAAHAMAEATTHAMREAAAHSMG